MVDYLDGAPLVDRAAANRVKITFQGDAPVSRVVVGLRIDLFRAAGLSGAATGIRQFGQHVGVRLAS